MLMPIIWLVAAMGALSVVVGAMRINDPTKHARAIAKREQRDKATKVDLKKAKSSGIALVIIGPMLLGLWIYVQFFMQ